MRKESKAARKRRLESEHKRRIETTRRKYGRDFYIRSGKKADNTATRFDSESGKQAALKRHHPEMFDE